MVEKAEQAAQMGIGMLRYQFMAKAGAVAKSMNLKTLWKNAPGKWWLNGVRKRNKTLTIRKQALLSVQAKGLNPDVTGETFLQLYELYRRYNLFNSPGKIHNMDESHCSFQHKPTHVLANCKIRNTPGRVSDSQEGTTFICEVSADGTHMPPVIIVKGKTPQSLLGYNTLNGPKDAKWTFQEKAWTEDVLDVEWFQLFLKHINKNNSQDDVHVLTLDTHGSHETTGLIAAARKANVILFCLPSHTTHFLQVLDKSIFSPFKTSYDKACRTFLQNPTNMICKMTWPGLFRKAFEEAFCPSNILSGFSGAGMFPWNPLAIPYWAFIPSQSFNTASPVGGEHPLGWVIRKVANIESSNALESADKTVMAILRTSAQSQNAQKTKRDRIQSKEFTKH